MEPSVLVIDDSPGARRHILDGLKASGLFQMYHEADSVVEGFKIALNEPVDIILCDLDMPGMDGFKFLSMIKTRKELQDIPVILVTGVKDQDTKIRGLERGASDYLTKPFDPGELIARVKVQLKIKSLQDSLKKSNMALMELSNTDPLTRLSNRRFLMKTLEKELQRCERSQKGLALIMVDVDHFKRINDNYGHQQGDVVLKTLADQMKGCLRDYDMAARFGGEEFALVLPETAIDEAVHVANRLRVAVSELRFPGEYHDIRLTISLGVATYPHNKVRTVDDLIREADRALYNAKEKGRNRVETILG
ncbi:MAG: diguanylate cyclase response regulator [Desulfuromonadaceae bacterium GWC2_58_13]|nr:MAG: diguanylate cyclase response regulator [Desulfuromonadaceae bacterium GWC2_58_13]